MPYVCIHAHIYQPSREDPWTGTWPEQPTAAPYRDWNTRIAAECYGPMGAARLLDGEGQTRAVRNLYGDLSFDVGPTLLQWLEAQRPVIYDALRDADRHAVQRSGHGSAMAQGFHHAILPLCNDRDRRTEIAWGVRDFSHRFGRPPEGFWMPETAVDTATLCDLADADIRFVVLAPHQLEAVRPMGDNAWQAPEDVDHVTTRPYRVNLPGGRHIVAFAYDGPLARGIAFEGHLHDGEALGHRWLHAARSVGGDGLVHLATDGESYGHHHAKGEMGLARAVEVVEQADDVQLVTYGAYLERVDVSWEATVVEESSWSCAHGVGRWSENCGCATPYVDGWHQRWRRPLRDAFDALRDAAQAVLAPQAEALFHHPDDARNAYVDLLRPHAPEAFDAWMLEHASEHGRTEVGRLEAHALLEIERHLLAMYTSCAWFFEDATRIETRQNLRHAACALGLLQETFGVDLHDAFFDAIAALPANRPTDGLVDLLHRHRHHPRPVRALHAPSTLDALAESGMAYDMIDAPPIACASRAAGLLLHVTALPGTRPIGDLDGAYALIDWLADAGLSIWQVLPLCPTGLGGSPYSSWSSLSGNPDLLGLDPLVKAGLLHDHEVHPPEPAIDRIDLDLLATWKRPLLDRAAGRLLDDPHHPMRADLDHYRHANPWAAKAGLFRALSRAHDGASWWTWPEPLRDRHPDALAEARTTYARDIDTWVAWCFFFDQQWAAVREYATSRGVRILGDLPIYVGHDSADVWAHQDVFQLHQGIPAQVSGVPPDAFSEDGQRWGNPVYDWDGLKADDYAWWVDRLRRAFHQTDLLRLDHFVGFVRYWSIPGEAPDATTGRWVPGPGLDFFRSMERQLGTLPLIVEDLGTVTDEVRDVQTTLGFPGMRVLQFGFDGNPANEHHPHNHPEASVAYVGTHDNHTALGWWSAIGSEERARTRGVFVDHDGWPHVELNRVALRSPAVIAVLTAQDVLGLGAEARFNVPGTVSGNWCWRMRPGALTAGLAAGVRAEVEASGRLGS